jgi:Family of unknown function (DUF6084)
MPDLDFAVEKAEAVAHAVSPLLNFSLRVTDKHDQPIHSVALRCQIRIEPGGRRYEPVEEQQLVDLFGPPSRWGQTLRTMLWTHTSVIVPPFSNSTVVNLPVPCTYDFNVAAAKYFYALADGEVPLCLLFSGTVFYASEDGSLQVEQISWEKEANFRLPVCIWKQMMEMYYPNSAWLCIHKDAFDRLYQYKSSHSLPTWEAAIEKLLAETDDRVMT